MKGIGFRFCHQMLCGQTWKLAVNANRGVVSRMCKNEVEYIIIAELHYTRSQPHDVIGRRTVLDVIIP